MARYCFLSGVAASLSYLSVSPLRGTRLAFSFCGKIAVKMFRCLQLKKIFCISDSKTKKFKMSTIELLNLSDVVITELSRSRQTMYSKF